MSDEQYIGAFLKLSFRLTSHCFGLSVPIFSPSPPEPETPLWLSRPASELDLPSRIGYLAAFGPIQPDSGGIGGAAPRHRLSLFVYCYQIFVLRVSMNFGDFRDSSNPLLPPYSILVLCSGLKFVSQCTFLLVHVASRPRSLHFPDFFSEFGMDCFLNFLSNFCRGFCNLYFFFSC